MKSTERTPHRVVAHLRDGKLVKGYTETVQPPDQAAMLSQDPIVLPDVVSLRSAESGELITVPLNSLKSLFFVKSFEGRQDYKEVKFFHATPAIEGLWVQVKFHDNESTEGVVHNSIRYLVDPGFFLKPPDPQSNNEIVYVVKASLVEFRVLGVKHTY